MEIDGVIIPARCAVEVTFRAHQQRFLLRPGPVCNEILLGCFGRAYHRHPSLNLNILRALANHGHFIGMPDSTETLSEFMRDFLSTAAKRLNLKRGRDGTFWEKRYSAIPILDEDMMEERFRYVLTQGTKENLVWDSRDWPGVSSVDTLLGGPPMIGRWLDGTATGELNKQRARKISRAAARGEKRELPPVLPVWRHYPIDLVPMPHWQDLKVGQRRARVAAMVQDDNAKTKLRHRRDGTAPCGVRAVLTTDPFTRPKDSSKRPAPVCHASSKRARMAFLKLRKSFIEAVNAATERTKAELPKLDVPKDACLPPLSHRDPRPAARPQPPLVDARGRIVAEPSRSPPATGPPATGPPRT